MEASTLNCPMCGAPSASNATVCEHCGARLAKVACPSCFGMIFTGSKFCQHCGAKIERTGESDATPRLCPRCREPLAAIALGSTKALECPHCAGLWIDTETFNGICADREKQAAVIGENPQPLLPDLPEFSLDPIRYAPCPVCTKLMNRVNFAHGSGVILDICKADGVWFERDELRRIVEFIRAGGLETSRERDREEWEAGKRKQTLSFPSGTADAGLDVSPGNFRETLNTGSLLIDILAAVARLLLK
jgi:Zn-finger nucleic acid-binding protein